MITNAENNVENGQYESVSVWWTSCFRCVNNSYCLTKIRCTNTIIWENESNLIIMYVGNSRESTNRTIEEGPLENCECYVDVDGYLVFFLFWFSYTLVCPTQMSKLCIERLEQLYFKQNAIFRQNTIIISLINRIGCDISFFIYTICPIYCSLFSSLNKITIFVQVKYPYINKPHPFWYPSDTLH